MATPARSPLAPEIDPMPEPVEGVRLASAEAGIRYRGRRDLMVAVFDGPATVAGVLTRSACASAPVDWCRERLRDGASARVLVVNAGNANAFTGRKGAEATSETARIAAETVGCEAGDVWLASTGVIGEPMSVAAFADTLRSVCKAVESGADAMTAASATIMTTDTFPKSASRRIDLGGVSVTITGIAKGSGMIAPDMAGPEAVPAGGSGTMLAFLFTDAAIAPPVLQALLERHTQTTFNAITVDGDTSTSDTILAFATGASGSDPIEDLGDPRAATFSDALHAVLHDLAQLTVRDGEGASKLVTVRVEGAVSDASAQRVAMSIANSPLVKTAIAGEDANWGRVVMAVGKAGEPADRDRLAIWFGDICVATEGERDPAYDEAVASAYMKNEEIVLCVDLGLGAGTYTAWTCDLTHGYIDINADYRS